MHQRKHCSSSPSKDWDGEWTTLSVCGTKLLVQGLHRVNAVLQYLASLKGSWPSKCVPSKGQSMQELGKMTEGVRTYSCKHLVMIVSYDF